MDQSERTLNMDAPEAVVHAAIDGNAEAVREWLATGGSPDATGQLFPLGFEPLLCFACMSCRPSNASVVEILCAAGASTEGVGDRGLTSLNLAAMHGAVDSVRALLRYGASVNGSIYLLPLHWAVEANNWRGYSDPWSRAHAQAAAFIGHQGVVRLLLKHGAAVNAITTTTKLTPLMFAAKWSGFVSLGVVRELLAGGANLDMVDLHGRNAEAFARLQLQKEICTGEGIPEHPRECRRPGAVEAFLALLAAVRAAGSWKRYAKSPRIDVVVLQALCAKGSATPPPVLARLFPTSTKSPHLPREIFWKILSFWRTDRDP